MSSLRVAQLHADAFEGTAARMAELLSPWAPVDRVKPRRLDDSELLAFAGTSRGGLYRLVESGALVPERAPVPGSRCYLTLEQIARWRVSRTSSENERPPVSAAATKGNTTNAPRDATPAARARQA